MSQFAPASSVLDSRVYWNLVGPSLLALRLKTVQKNFSRRRSVSEQCSDGDLRDGLRTRVRRFFFSDVH